MYLLVGPVGIEPPWLALLAQGPNSGSRAYANQKQNITGLVTEDVFVGRPRGDRTHDPRIKSPLL